MLVLSRKKNEAIVINNETIIHVIEIRGDKVRLGIETPSLYSVHRKEVYDAMQKENKNSVLSLKSVELMLEENNNGETELIRYGFLEGQNTPDNKIRHVLFRGTKASCLLYLDILKITATTITAPAVPSLQ